MQLSLREAQKIKDLELKHLPEERDKYWRVILADGTLITEHICNWGNVPIMQVTRLELHMGEIEYHCDIKELPPTFVGFIHFKTASRRINDGTQIDRTVSRCIGWTDGEKEYLVRINEKDGKPAGPPEVHSPSPETGLPMHLHPELRDYIISKRARFNA